MKTSRGSNWAGRRARLFALVCAMAAVISGSLAAADDKKDEKSGKRPSLSLKAAPAISFSPSRIVVTAELKGEIGNPEEYYCPNLEWDWDDGTKSEAKLDCDPYEAGKSEVRRRFTGDHTYQTAGNYRIQLRLKRGTKIITGGNTTLQVKPGPRDLSNNY
jgi:hypothetical protein